MINNEAIVENYIHANMNEEDEILKELERYTYLNVLRPRMLSGHIQGTFLRFVCEMINPQKVLEIGTFTGYSAICMAKGTSANTIIDTVEINDELEPLIRKFLKKAEVDKKVNLHIGNALEITDTIVGDFNLIFIDGDKREYPNYYNKFIERVSPGGWIIADNTLWSGKVTDISVRESDPQTKGIVEFNKIVKQDPRTENVILPVRDGLTIIKKIV
ncbi:class I SAM-dependent methyltransferase [Marinilabiliaceae bacterium ANBcel2]|nr:class I SAM-dependent methyltransferase [Marinilabiliaceae bacterium ANBcel2]